MEITKEIDLNLSLNELLAIKERVMEVIKEKRNEDKNKKLANKIERENFAKTNLAPGKVVMFNYKGEDCEGEVLKINDKTFTVAFTYEGTDKVLPRLYSLFISITEE